MYHWNSLGLDAISLQTYPLRSLLSCHLPWYNQKGKEKALPDCRLCFSFCYLSLSVTPLLILIRFFFHGNVLKLIFLILYLSNVYRYVQWSFKVLGDHVLCLKLNQICHIEGKLVKYCITYTILFSIFKPICNNKIITGALVCTGCLANLTYRYFRTL